MENCGKLWRGDYENRISSLQQNLKDGRFEDIGIERKPNKLQRELSRLSSLEVALRSEMQVLKGNSLDYQEVEGDHRSGEDTKSAEAGMSKAGNTMYTSD